MKSSHHLITGIFFVVLSIVAVSAQDFHEAVEKFFNSSDNFIQNTVIPNIEKNRKSDFKVRFMDPQGKSLDSLPFAINHIRHDFLFGATPPSKNFEQQRVQLWADIFNYGVPQNATKWKSTQPGPDEYNFTKLEQIVDTALNHNAEIEHHFLTGYHPEWLADYPNNEKAVYQKAHAKEVVTRYKDKIKFFQVYNEDWITNVERAEVFFDQTEFFAELVNEFPGVKFGYCDCWSIDTTRSLPDPEELEERYPGISFISAHAHYPRRKWISPQEMYDNFDLYLDSDVKIHLTEFGLFPGGEIEGDYRSGDWDDEAYAEYYVQMFAVSFSHPSVEAFNQWGFAPEDSNRFTTNIIITSDYETTPTYDALKSLIKKKFNTQASGSTNASGTYTFNGFHGMYEVSVTNNSGLTAAVEAPFNPVSNRTAFIVKEEGGSLQIIKAAKYLAVFPGKAEAEDFCDISGERIEIEECQDVGGTEQISNVRTGDWIDYYVIVPTPGTYKLNYRVAAPTGGKIELVSQESGTVLATTEFAASGGWATVSTAIDLDAGAQTLRINVLEQGFTLNWLEFISDPTIIPQQKKHLVPASFDLIVLPSGILYTVPDLNGKTSRVNIEIYDVKGALLMTLVNELKNAGSYSVALRNIKDYNAKCSAGIYLCRMKAEGFTKTVKIVRNGYN